MLVDTNVLIYGRTRRSVQCSRLLERLDDGAVSGVITSFILAEYCHRRMVQEAQSSGLAGSNPARQLSRRPERIRRLSRYAGEVRLLLASSLKVETPDEIDFAVALELQRNHGLLTVDSINLAIAQRRGIRGIATADAGFEAVQGCIVYRPDDLDL